MGQGPRGRFGLQCVVGGYDVDPHDFAAKMSRCSGCRCRTRSCMARCATVKGNLYSPMRRIRGGRRGQRAFLVADLVRLGRDAHRSRGSSVGTVDRRAASVDDEGVRLASPPDAEGERFEVTATTDSFSWRRERPSRSMVASSDRGCTGTSLTPRRACTT